MVVVLHNIRSVFNVASIFRTADGVGIEKIYLCGITPGPVDKFGDIRKDFSKVSLGAENFINWERKYSTVKLLKKLKADGYEVIAVEQDLRSVPYYEIAASPSAPRNDAEGKICLVMGAEVGGLPKPVLELADKIVEIPMRGKKESLNVAVAFGIVVYHLLLFTSEVGYKLTPDHTSEV